MIAINGSWLGHDFKKYRICLEFILVVVSHSGENLAVVVFRALKRHGLLQKLLSITADNATNNDTALSHFHKTLLKALRQSPGLSY
jgi:hypothetical protein